MSHIGKIKIKNLQDLVETKAAPQQKEQEKCDESEDLKPNRTPLKRRVKANGKSEHAAEIPSSATTTPTKKLKPGTVGKAATTSKKTTLLRTCKKEPPPNQMRIDSFFKSSSKTYCVVREIPTVSSVNGKENHKKQATPIKSSAKNRGRARVAARAKVRKRLYEEEEEEEEDTTETETTTSLSCVTKMTPPKDKDKGKSPSSSSKRKTPKKTKSPAKVKARTPLQQKPAPICIDLCSDSEEEPTAVKQEALVAKNSACPPMVSVPASVYKSTSTSSANYVSTSDATSNAAQDPAPTTASSHKRPRRCPAYKVVHGTSFAVDAFQYGRIANVTHYFLTHFHADHYVGLTRKFAMPIYMSVITARLVRAFIPLEEQYIHEIDMYIPQVIEGVEVTAIDANHCPGAVMLIFKLTTGKCVLHTGDFRANAEMESEPIFWNNDIDTIYLDTTYLSNKYDFCLQSESIARAIRLVREFRERHAGKRILYVCGSYLVGKEKFWGSLAEVFDLTIWTEDNRRKALEAMANVSDIGQNAIFQRSPLQANMHVIAMGKLSYLSLVEYFKPFAAHYDILLAIRPSGWEKNSKPKYGKTINIIGIEYSEHSSHKEMQRFVSFLKPREVISTVVMCHKDAIAKVVPLEWYKYDKLSSAQRSYQPTITSYLKLNTNTKSNAINTPNNSKPLKSSRTPTNACESITLNLSDGDSVDALLQDSPLTCKRNNVVDASMSRHDSDAVSDWLS